MYDAINNKFVIEIFSILSNSEYSYCIVGGAVRDYMWQQSFDDIDIEVYTKDFSAVCRLFTEYDCYINEKFYTIKIGNIIEIGLARTEDKVGIGYNEYIINLIGTSNYRLATIRRDFTINSLLYDYDNDEIIDIFNGIADINSKTIRCIDEIRFIDDPIRTLRFLKYLFKFNLSYDLRTYQLAKQMSYNLFDQPSIKVASLLKQIVLAPYFDIEIFIDILEPFFKTANYHTYISNSYYHPEGILYNHLVGVIKCLDLFDISTKDYLTLFWSLFFHDYGKLIGKSNHESLSVIFYQKYANYVTINKKQSILIADIIKDHMIFRKYALIDNIMGINLLKKKYNNQLYLLEIVATCDYAGRVKDFNIIEIEERKQYFEKNVVIKYQ